ncbi:hypothetical protein ACC695_39245, partial [Rhizobium ruizarguesonis]
MDAAKQNSDLAYGSFHVFNGSDLVRACRSPDFALEDHITAVLARSVALDAKGQLEIRDTPELVSLKEQYDGLWYV